MAVTPVISFDHGDSQKRTKLRRLRWQFLFCKWPVFRHTDHAKKCITVTPPTLWRSAYSGRNQKFISMNFETSDAMNILLRLTCYV